MAKQHPNVILKQDEGLFSELSQLIEQSQQQVSIAANSGLTILFWQVGKRINERFCKINGQIMVKRLWQHYQLNWFTHTVGILR